MKKISIAIALLAGISMGSAIAAGSDPVDHDGRGRMYKDATHHENNAGKASPAEAPAVTTVDDRYNDRNHYDEKDFGTGRDAAANDCEVTVMVTHKDRESAERICVRQ